MNTVRFIAITDTTRVSVDYLLGRASELCAACRPGTVMIQLRDRQLCARDRLRLGERLARITRCCQQKLSVNDRIDLAVILNADGVHLGEASAPTGIIRARFGHRFWLTRAVHDPQQCQLRGADALVLSPIGCARKAVPAWGVHGLKLACQTSNVPIYALGGIDADNAASCLAAGAAGIAAIGAWLSRKSLRPLIDAIQLGQMG